MEHWISCSRPMRLPFTPVPAVAVLPMVLIIVWPRMWTFCVLLAIVAVLTLLRIKGRTTTWIYQRFFGFMRQGKVRARPLWYRRRSQRIESYDTLVLQPPAQAERPAKPPTPAAAGKPARPAAKGGK